MNCVANGKLLKEKIFDNIWIQPASGDAGSSLGAALFAWHEYFKKPRKENKSDSMKGTYLGCNFSNQEIIGYLKGINAPFQSLEDLELFEKLAQILEEGKVIGWFNGPMEFGPRALEDDQSLEILESEDAKRNESKDKISREFSSICSFSFRGRCCKSI